MMSKGYVVTVFSSVQWLIFIFANTVVVPISIGTVFEVPQDTIGMMLRCSLILTGVACMFQGWIGHRMPIMEGHSGLLWGVILNLGLTASSMGMSLSTIGGGITTGILLACAFTIVLAACNGLSLFQSLFSPMVMSVYLFLLTFQLIFIFFKGMFPLTKDGVLDIPLSLLSIGIVILVVIIKLKGSKSISNFSILIGLMIGWILHDLLFMDASQGAIEASSMSFTFFPIGEPNLEFGIIGVTFFAVVINLSNTFASIEAAGKLINKETPKHRFRNSIYVTSVFTAIGSGFGLVPYTPFTSSIGFLQSTRIFHSKPFLIGGGLLTTIGLVPIFGSFLATMPISVGNAVLFVAYLQLFGTAFSSLNGKTFNSNTIFRLAAPVLVGISIMNISPTVFSDIPLYIQPFISNGLIIGVLLSVTLEKLVNWKVFETVELNR
jgi:xanthine/uracil permease